MSDDHQLRTIVCSPNPGTFHSQAISILMGHHRMVQISTLRMLASVQKHNGRDDDTGHGSNVINHRKPNPLAITFPSLQRFSKFFNDVIVRTHRKRERNLDNFVTDACDDSVFEVVEVEVVRLAEIFELQVLLGGNDGPRTLPTAIKKEKNAFAIRVFRWSPAERSARSAWQGPWRMLLATSRIQNLTTKIVMVGGRVFFSTESPNMCPKSTTWPMRKTTMATASALAAMKERRRPKRDVQWSLW
ncbi:hypothetical protein SESBI_14943 [Sesbania bispinosa]|nr:hypothetical protein SESBI_14943 [Sesbania bispinosa]